MDGMGKGRPAMDSAAYGLSPRLGHPSAALVPDNREASRIRQQARTRAVAVLKVLHSKDFQRIYSKELEHLSEQHAIENENEAVARRGKMRSVRRVEGEKVDSNG